jgi:hypothetical protein
MLTEPKSNPNTRTGSEVLKAYAGHALGPKNLDTITRKFTDQLRHDFAYDIARDPKTFKNLVIQLVRRQLPPRQGRPNDPWLDTAARMIEQGKSIKEVLRAQLPGFDRLDDYGRYLAEKGLRAALARRRRKHLS